MVTLSPGQSVDLSLSVPEGKVSMLTAEQVEGAVELRFREGASARSEAPDLFTNRAGLHARIRVLVAPDEHLTIGNASKDRTAKAVVAAGAPAMADANAQLERAAERAFAHAELLRTRDKQDQAAAMQAYDQAIAGWQSAGNQAGLARALIWKADFIVNDQGQPALAPPVIERATALVPSLEPIEAAQYWQVIAFIHTVQGDYATVKDAYRHGLALYEAVGDIGHQAKVLDNSARVELMEGHVETALADEKRAAELATRAADARREAFVQEELGAIYATVGDSESAYRAYGEALRQLKRLPPEPRMQAAIWVDLSDLYVTLGDLARVKDALDQATAILNTTDYPVGIVDTLNNYGDLYLEKGDPQAARRYFTRGLSLATSSQYERGRIVLLSGIGDSYLYERDAKRAEDILERALGRAQQAGQTDSEIQIRCQLGDLASLKQDFKQAGHHYEACRKESVTAHDTYSEIRANGGLARTAFRSGALDEAQSYCEHALGMIEATRGQLRNQDLRTSFFASQHAYYDLDIRILERQDQLYPNQGYAWQAFLIAERGRARTLLDQVTASDTPTQASPALLALYDDVQRRLRRLETSPATRGHDSPAVQGTIERLTVSEHQLHDEIVAAGEPGTTGQPSRPLTLTSLEDALPHHATLVEYWTGETASYAWSITPRGIRSFHLPPAPEVGRQCLAYRKALLAAVSPDPNLTAEQRAAMRSTMQGQLRRVGWQLSRTLLPSGILAADTETVFLVGDGSTESVPFAALPEGAPRRRIGFLNEPSATIFSILETASTTPHPMRLAVFAVDQTSAPQGETKFAVQTQQFSALPFAGNEATMIRATMGSEATRLFSGSNISRATLENLDWSEFSIGHFAMHAVLNEQYAELSGLTLGSRRGSNSGPANFLWYGDVCHLHAKLDLVVLSACDTARGAQVPGEGLRGLTQAFFAAGSQRVLGTLWEVDDQATSEWMGHFYRALKKTRSPATALQDAQKAMAADPQWSAPYYWAGFVLAGDWRPLP